MTKKVIYPATYNYPEETMRSTAHEFIILERSSHYLQVTLLNVSPNLNYSQFEFMAFNITRASSLRWYYCNSTYVSGALQASPYCTQYCTIEGGTLYNHSHTVNSNHSICSFSNNGTGVIGDVVITSNSSMIARGANLGDWAIGYIPEVYRQGALQNSTTNGVSWINVAGTLDAHLHQYNGSELLSYYACAYVTGNPVVGNCSNVSTDLIQMGGMPPTAPNVYAPTNTTYTAGQLDINWTASISPNNYDITQYNVSLLYPNETFITTINGNWTPNLNFSWNTTNYTGNYTISVEACDSNGLCATGFSEEFEIEAATTDDASGAALFGMIFLMVATAFTIIYNRRDDKNDGSSVCPS